MEVAATRYDCITSPRGYSVTDYSAHSGTAVASATHSRGEDCRDLGPSYVIESPSIVDNLKPLTGGDMEPASVTAEETSWQCPLDTPTPAAVYQITGQGWPSVVHSTANESGSLCCRGVGRVYFIRNCPPIPRLIPDSDRESQLGGASAELRSIGDTERRLSDARNDDSEEGELLLMVRKRVCSGVGQAEGDAGNSISDSNSVVQLQSTEQIPSPKNVAKDPQVIACPCPPTLFRVSPPRSYTREKPHVCDTCGKAYTRAWNLSIHIRSHIEERPFKCDTCGKTFAQAKNLSKHSHVHTGERSYTCDTCGKAFTSAWNLSQHVLIHTGGVPRPYSCDTCGKAFPTTTCLSDHIRVHTGERPFSCDTCGRSFTQAKNLNKHIRKHTGRFACDTCGKTFTSSACLIVHTRSHTGEKPFVCDTCGKAFTQAGNLNKHIRIHTGERPFTCNTCGKTFSRSSSLSRHAFTHTGERPYSCGICGKAFTTAWKLSQHVERHARGQQSNPQNTC